MELRLEMAHQLNQKMMTSLSLLKLNIMDLKEYVDNLTSSNIMIEISDPKPLPELPFADKRRRPNNDFDTGQYLENLPDERLENNVTEMLLREVDHLKTDDNLKKAVRYLINTLDENGYLTESAAESAAFLGITIGMVNRAVEILQTMDPPGLGAADLKTCLEIQLKRRGLEDSTAYRMVNAYLSLVAEKKYRQLSELLGTSVQDIKEAVSVIESLNPKPLNGMGRSNNTFYITPDFYVIEENNKATVLMNDYYLPELKIHELYRDWLKAGDLPAEDKEFLRSQLQSARDALAFIDYRKNTLKNVADYIVSRQASFFSQGPGHRQNLTSKEIAEAMGVHESTISRAVSDKYFECEYGIFPLKYLICRTGVASSGQSASSLDDLLNALKQVFENEDLRHPLSDQEAAEALSALGFRLSRRTVAKYRQNLGIPTAGIRKERVRR